MSVGILMRSMGFSFLYPMLMSMFIYAFNTSLTFDEAFKEADEALYHSKRNGRSQFTIKYQL